MNVGLRNSMSLSHNILAAKETLYTMHFCVELVIRLLNCI
jgi:hypothetical protein